ncbi:hypothetical protein F5B22DRAFT_541005 [Xylaria bambusicola]|uniref:uncharacterized protein n=1 Tax=Xylaria bambusicola TaxID=326684 RepID=UPI002008C3A4|nr:uncharacterized protein F5B22DRAFT_541005 [Xylaria bambusicola]KAI0521525.1 hypothetical protein F5B22DRAFT_541005 [Xylaria bambusicola]
MMMLASLAFIAQLSNIADLGDKPAACHCSLDLDSTYNQNQDRKQHFDIGTDEEVPITGRRDPPAIAAIGFFNANNNSMLHCKVYKPLFLSLTPPFSTGARVKSLRRHSTFSTNNSVRQMPENIRQDNSCFPIP